VVVGGDFAGIKALTLWQPWATLIALGRKRLETRGWVTAYRGSLAIHAARRPPDPGLLAAEPFAGALRDALARGPLPRGAVVAVARLVDVLPITPALVAGLTQEERAFGIYGPCRWAWRLEEVRLLDPPIPARGAQGLWSWRPPSGLALTPPPGSPARRG
jgi:hypothetical protein